MPERYGDGRFCFIDLDFLASFYKAFRKMGLPKNLDFSENCWVNLIFNTGFSKYLLTVLQDEPDEI